jgi:DNA repair photolyase
MKQTAIEWLSKELESFGDPIMCKLTWEELDSIIEQAKEMEKQQIMDAFNSGENSDDYFFPSLKLKESEVYYNETYKSKQDEKDSTNGTDRVL